MNLIRHNFPATQYVRERTEKRQIVLHHTASGPGVDGDIAWWMKMKRVLNLLTLVHYQDLVIS